METEWLEAAPAVREDTVLADAGIALHWGTAAVILLGGALLI